MRKHIRIKDLHPYNILLQDILARDSSGLSTAEIHILLSPTNPTSSGVLHLRTKLFYDLGLGTKRNACLYECLHWEYHGDTVDESMKQYYDELGEWEFYDNIINSKG